MKRFFHLAAAVFAALSWAEFAAAQQRTEFAGHQRDQVTTFGAAEEWNTHYLDALRHARELNYKEAIHSGESALQTAVMEFGDKSFEHLFSLNALGVLVGESGDSTLAMEYFQRVIDSYVEGMSPESRRVYSYAVGNASRLLISEGDHETAGSILREAISRLEDAPFDTADLLVVTSYGELLQLTGDTSSAAWQFEMARNISIENLGPSHPQTIEIVNNLGVTYWSQGDIDKAASIIGSAYDTSLESGNEIGIITSATNLGALNLAAGDAEMAKEWYEIAVRRNFESLVPHNAMLRSAEIGLARSRISTNDLSDTEFFENLYSSRTEALGSMHIDTLTAQAVVAQYLAETDQTSASATLVEDGLEKSVVLLGSEDPVTKEFFRLKTRYEFN